MEVQITRLNRVLQGATPFFVDKNGLHNPIVFIEYGN